jgi:hypothetical protein
MIRHVLASRSGVHRGFDFPHAKRLFIAYERGAPDTGNAAGIRLNDDGIEHGR